MASGLFQNVVGRHSAPELAIWLASHLGRNEWDGSVPGREADWGLMPYDKGLKSTQPGNTGPDWLRIAELILLFRSLRNLADQAVDHSHIATILVNHAGQVLESDLMAESLLREGKIIFVSHGCLTCAESDRQIRFQNALKETLATGQPISMLLSQQGCPDHRYSLSIQRTPIEPAYSPAQPEKYPGILCLLAPLDQRRIATAHQLMELFGLSAAEARLARGLCHGYSLDQYAKTQNVRLPTVRTQLRAIFVKTRTGRQADLVRLITNIPVVRDTCPEHRH